MRTFAKEHISKVTTEHTVNFASKCRGTRSKPWLELGGVCRGKLPERAAWVKLGKTRLSLWWRRKAIGLLIASLQNPPVLRDPTPET